MKKGTFRDTLEGPGRNGGRRVDLAVWLAAKQDVLDYKAECKHDYRVGKSRKLVARTKARRAMVRASRRNNRKVA